MSKERLIISQLVNQVSDLDEEARRQFIDCAVDNGVINEVSAGMLIQTLKVIEEKDRAKSKTDLDDNRD